MFVDRYPQRALGDVRERFTTAAGDGEPEFDADAYRDHLAARVTAAQGVTQQDLEALGEGRAGAVRDFLLGAGDAPGIEPARVRRLAPVAVEADGAVALEIGLAAD